MDTTSRRDMTVQGLRREVQLDTFRRSLIGRSSVARSSTVEEALPTTELRPTGSGDLQSPDQGDPEDNNEFDVELLDAYIAYCRSVGHEPNIQINLSALPFDRVFNPQGSGLTSDEGRVTRDPRPGQTSRAGAPTLLDALDRDQIQQAARMHAVLGLVTDWSGAQHVQVTEDYTYLHFLEEVDFHLTYTIETPDPSSNATANASYFNALLFNEYEHYVDGEPFEYIEAGSKLRTTYAYLPHTYIDNTIKETMYFVVQPCYLERNPTADYCNTTQFPTSVYSSEKIYNLDQKKKMKKKAVWEHFNVTYMSVNPMPVACSSSGIVGGAYLLLFLPYLIISLFGLRVFQMITHCESFQKNIERIYARELNVPEDEVDYWQPMPWDRKVPKTRLCGPCCWKKFRRPFEPFYTWWRHENYFTWVLCPYRNERLSRGERALIVVCSLYVTFYRDSAWYLIIQTWGWKDLCPHCTERIKHCDCFNDELLLLAVERVGPKWELIRVLDGLMARQNNFEAQFEPYTSEQLRERWDVIVERAEKHMENVENLRAYQEKKRLEALQRDQSRRSLIALLSRRRASERDVNDIETHPISSTVDNTDSSSSESDIHFCNLREKKILELNGKIKLEEFEKHYDSNISEDFHALTRSVMKLHRHGKREHRRNQSEPDEDQSSDREDEHEGGQSPRSAFANRQTPSSSDGETMWVFNTPEQRLQRREEEKLERKRAFRVLNDYNIESVDSAATSTSEDEFGSASNLPMSPGSHQDSKEVPLLPDHNRLARSRENEVVVPMAGDENENLDGLTTSRVDSNYSDGSDSEYPNEYRRSGQDLPSTHRACHGHNPVHRQDAPDPTTQRPRGVFNLLKRPALVSQLPLLS
ncbi:hypothetical protein PF006_g28080 [Phytophthora fragariae]|uniref:Uncharacterized protein n=1 Tax=Phytophthora fragariae TaxID=53985 RepID=A0A6A3QI32_9STRA|nr:hypothetical protein PF003_g24339 [Phytophthora fragariae]KAE9076667.1 hypothetical protein PF006_g28080 [Phytophthora fragariae]